MKRNFLACLTTSLVLQLFGFAVPQQIFAQAALPQIALSVAEASPGATIEVEGGRFVADAIVSFYLFHAGGQVQLGSVIADDHGEFLTSVFLPLDLEPGLYEFHAIDEENHVIAASLAIIPDASGQAQNDPRAEDDSLLGPMPTSVRAVAGSQAGPAPASQESTLGRSSLAGVLVVLAAVGAVLAAAWSVLKRR